MDRRRFLLNASGSVAGGLLLAAWIVATTVVNIRERGRGVRGGVGAQLARQPRS